MAAFEGWSLALVSMEQAGLEVDLAGLVETYAELLFRVAHSVLRSPVDAEDVVQDVFVRMMEHERELAGVRDMRVWLVRIAWRLALDRRRRVRPAQMDAVFVEGLVAPGAGAERAMEEAQRMGAVLEEMERLPRKEREALLLSAVEELGTAELADVLGRSESAVRALLFRARARLRERLLARDAVRKGAGR